MAKKKAAAEAAGFNARKALRGVKMAIVVWADHVEMVDDDITIEETADHMIFASAGILVEETDKHIKLCRDVRGEDQALSKVLTIVKPVLYAKVWTPKY